MKKYKLQNIQSSKRPIMVFFYFEKGVLLKQFKSFYKEVGGNEGSKCNYPIRLDTYRMSVAATIVSIAMQNPY